jgi:hypothetical protein
MSGSDQRMERTDAMIVRADLIGRSPYLVRTAVMREMYVFGDEP